MTASHYDRFDRERYERFISEKPGWIAVQVGLRRPKTILNYRSPPDPELDEILYNAAVGTYISDNHRRLAEQRSIIVIGPAPED